MDTPDRDLMSCVLQGRFALVAVIFGLSSLISGGAIAAPIIFDSAAAPIQEDTLVTLGDFNWPFHRFEILTTTQLDTVGGYFQNFTTVSQDIFAAVVQLAGPSDLPDSLDLTSGDLLGTTLISVGTGVGTGSNSLSLNLTPGWYALEFGTNAFGSPSAGFGNLGMPRHDTDPDISQNTIVAIETGNPYLSPQFVLSGVEGRFFATGTVVPEPTSVTLVGMALIGIAWARRRTLAD